MPDYSLPRNNPQPQQTQPQTPSPISQLSSASQQSKLKTENDLLREALAMSAQNCETLMKQLAESQQVFQRQVREEIKIWQQAHMEMNNTMKRQLEKMSATVEQYGKTNQQQISQYSQSHQNQLAKLENMNQTFNKNLTAVLAQTRDSLVAQIRADAKTALDANCDTMLGIIETMEIAHKGVTDNVKVFNKNLNDTFKKSRAILDNHVKRYNSSVERLFEIDTMRKRLFYFGIFGGIATPIVLFVIVLIHIFA